MEFIIIFLAVLFLFYIYTNSSEPVITTTPQPTITIAPTGSIAVAQDPSVVPIPASQVIIGASPNPTVVSTHDSSISNALNTIIPPISITIVAESIPSEKSNSSIIPLSFYNNSLYTPVYGSS